VNAVEIIERKKRGAALDEREIAFAVEGFTGGGVADYQMSALLMAIWCRGMEPRETAALNAGSNGSAAAEEDSSGLQMGPGLGTDAAPPAGG
jgi:pyrimidine-nucleoside phosphorylase